VVQVRVVLLRINLPGYGVVSSSHHERPRQPTRCDLPILHHLQLLQLPLPQRAQFDTAALVGGDQIAGRPSFPVRVQPVVARCVFLSVLFLRCPHALFNDVHVRAGEQQCEYFARDLRALSNASNFTAVDFLDRVNRAQALAIIKSEHQWSAPPHRKHHSHDQLHRKAELLPASLCDAQLLLFVELALVHVRRDLRALQHAPVPPHAAVGVDARDLPPFAFLNGRADPTAAALALVPNLVRFVF
jgi:hypothetical protein